MHCTAITDRGGMPLAFVLDGGQHPRQHAARIVRHGVEISQKLNRYRRVIERTFA